VEVRQRLEAAQAKETDRALQFDKAMREGETAPLSAKAPAALETARSLARLETEKSALDQLIQRRAAARQAEETGHDRELSPRLAEVSRALDQLERRAAALDQGSADAAAIVATIAETQRSLSDMEPDLVQASEAIQGRADNLEHRLDAIRARLDQRDQRTRLEEAITAAVAYSPASRGFTNPAAYADALQAFNKSWPNDPRAKAFSAILREQPLWNAIGEWDRLAAPWRSTPWAVAPQEAKIRAEQCRQFLAQHPGAPDVDRSALYQRYMEAVARRGADADGALFKLQRLLSDSLVENLWMVTVKPPLAEASRRYYLPQPLAPDAKSVGYLAGFDGKERQVKFISDWIEATDVAPQSKIAARFKPIFSGDAARIDWETASLNLLEQIRTQPEIDPVLQVALLRKVLESSIEGSELLREVIGAFKNRLDQADVDVNVPWMDPDNKDADHMRIKAAGVIRSLPELASARKDLSARRAQVERQLARHAETIGWLSRQPDGWRAQTGAVLPQQGILWVAVPGQNQRAAWRKIGLIQQGKPQLSTGDDTALAEGRPIFVTSPDGGGS
jgi:hypothetical protein